MDAIARFLRGFGRFWYDFVVGDDPKIAVAIATVLALGAVLVAAGVTGAGVVLLVAALLFAGFSTAMVIDVRRTRR